MRRTTAFAIPTGIPTGDGADGPHPNVPRDDTSAASAELMGGSFTIRDLRTSDAQTCEQFFRHLDPQGVRLRFAGHRGYSADLFLPETDRAFASTAFAAVDPTDAVLGILNIATLGPDTAEVAIIIRSDRKRCGIGRSLLTHVIQGAPPTAITQVFGYVLAENKPMLALPQTMGFIRRSREAFFIIVSHHLSLTPSSASASASASAGVNRLRADGRLRD